MANGNYPLELADIMAMRSKNDDPYKDFNDTIGVVSSSDSGLGVPPGD